MIDSLTRTTRLPARRLSPRVLEGLEKRAMDPAVPSAKLPEIIELRAALRDLVAHVNALEGIGREDAGK